MNMKSFPQKTLIILSLCYGNSFLLAQSTFTDPRDQQTYKTVQINSLTWFAENLDFNSPGSIENEGEYGRLYIWDMAQSACPDGWRLPTEREWLALFKTFEIRDLKSTKGWDEQSGSNKSGFSALPTGAGWKSNELYFQGEAAYWWTSSEFDENYAYKARLGWDKKDSYAYYKRNLNSCRCVKD